MMWVGQWAAQCTNLLNSIAQQFQDFTYWKEAKHWVVSLHVKASKFSVSHSPPTLISYNSLCRKYALPIFQLLAYCNSIRWRHTNVGYAQVHSIFIYLVQVGDTSNVKATLNNMQEHVAFWCHVCIFNHPSLCIAFWRLLGSETGNYYYLYLDAGVVPYGNSTCDLWPFNMHSLTR